MRTQVERINIKGLSVEAPVPQQEFPFDAEIDFPEVIWIWIKRRLEVLKDYPKSQVARDLKIVSPKKLEQFGITEPSWADVIPDRPKFGFDNIPSLIRKLIANYNIAFPGYAERTFPGINWYQYMMKPGTKIQDSGSLFEAIWEAAGLVPEKVNQELGVDRELLERLSSYVKDNNHPTDKAEAAALIRIVFPEDFGNLHIDSDFWHTSKVVLAESSKGLTYAGEAIDDLAFARNLIIMTAQEVHLNENGLSVVPYRRKKDDSESDQHHLPEVRRF